MTTQDIMNGNQVRQVSVDQVMRLMNNGVVVDLHIGRSRFSIQIDSEDLKLSEELKKVVDESKLAKLGSWATIEKKYTDELNKLEVRARCLLKSYSFRTIWGYFVPASSFDFWKERNDEIKQQFFAVRDRIIVDLDVIKEKLRKEYSESGNAGLVEMILQAVPLPTTIMAQFKFDTVYTAIPMAQVVGSSSNVDPEIEKIEKDFAEKILNKEYVGKKKEYIDSFIGDVFTQLSETVKKAVNEVLQDINEDKFDGHSVRRLKTLIENMKRFDFYEDVFQDASISKMVQKLNESLTLDKMELSKVLLGIKNQTVAEMESLSNRRFEMLEF